MLLTIILGILASYALIVIFAVIISRHIIKNQIKRYLKDVSLPTPVFYRGIGVDIKEKNVSAYNRLIHAYGITEKFGVYPISYGKRQVLDRSPADYFVTLLKNPSPYLSEEERTSLLADFDEAFKSHVPAVAECPGQRKKHL